MIFKGFEKVRLSQDSFTVRGFFYPINGNPFKNFTTAKTYLWLVFQSIYSILTQTILFENSSISADMLLNVKS